MKRFFTLLLVTALVITTAVIPAAANSARTHWTGVDATGAMIQNENCPIVVEAERLTFDLPQFPDVYFRDVDEFLAYSGRVTAEYTFYNPADYAVTATLLFPFGSAPHYAPDDCYGRDVENYDILVNGTPIDRTLRHSLSDRYEQFDLETDLALLQDTERMDDFFAPELPVTQYVFVPEGVDTETYDAADAGFDIDQGERLRKVLFPEQSGLHLQDDGSQRVHAGVENGEPLTVYVIGQDYAAFPQWTFYEDGGVEDGEEIAGTMREVSRQGITFRDLAMSEWDPESGISETDWYNAVVAMATSESNARGANLHLWEFGGLDLRDSLMRWYAYEIHLEPGERIVNTVTAPIYPSIDEGYEPPIYAYTYLLSPARTWAAFGTLDIVVNTPFYMTASGPEGFERTDTGYAVHLNGLPEGELTFTLSEGKLPIRSNNYSLGLWLVFLTALAALLAGTLLTMGRGKQKSDKT